MPWHKMFLAAAMAAVVTATFLPIEASARWRGWGYRDVELGLSGADFCGGRLPAYGTDACGYREVSYGPDRAGGVCRTGRMARNLVACGSADRVSTPARA